MSEQPEQLTLLAYASIAKHLFSHDELIALLDHARKSNANIGVTGMLLYVEGSFFQVLEGERAKVDTLYAKISGDARHHQVMKLIEEDIAERCFNDWSMGYAQVTREELASIPGMSDFLTRQASPFTDIKAPRARMLLEAFREGKWQRKPNTVGRYVYR